MPGRPIVLLTEPIAEEATAVLRARCEVRLAPSVRGPELERAVTDVDAIIVRSTPLPATTIAAAPGLRVIGRHGAGVENVDVAAATARGIPVVNTPGANADSVAEFVLMTMLMSLRRVIEIRADLLSGALDGGSLPGTLARTGRIGDTLGDRVVGIVGFGAIGRRVARLCEALGARVLFFDPYGPPDDDRSRSLEDIFAASDIVTLHLPVTPETTGLIDRRLLDLGRPGACLVNAARAEVVDETAVLSALDDGRLSTYATDVWDPEPPRPDDPLLRHPRVLATPHMAAITHDALRSMSDAVVRGVLAVLDGERPPAVVNPAVIA